MKIIRKRIFMLVLLVMMLAIPSTTSASMSISNTSVKMAVGTKKKVSVNGTTKTVKWSSNHKAVAKVYPDGTITAVAKGSTSIVGKVGTKQFVCKVAVYSPKISKTALSLTTGKSATLSVTGTAGTVRWSSQDKNIAAVSTSGKVTAKKAGTVLIYAKTLGKTLKCKVTITKAASTSPSPESPVSGDVWLSATGSKYHRINNCGRMNPATATRVTLSYAQSHGYGKCSTCW